MNEHLIHRGPDDAGLWEGGGAGIAARRLSILDVQKGHQPMVSEDGSLVVALNGEIYNYEELQRDLLAKGHHFQTNCDTEVVLNAFLEYGDGALYHFNGMFAIAVLDTKQRRLLLARDRLGIKPLFYTVDGGTLAFSSELHSLLHSGHVSGKLNLAALDAYFTFLYIPAPQTIFENVAKLGPGEALVFKNGEISITPYWKPQAIIDSTWTLDSAAEAYTELLRDAVRLQRISDVPLGAF
jgi:asparagine synthase (glutamine-hydrolysing)